MYPAAASGRLPGVKGCLSETVMVLVDTSVWLRYLANRDPYTKEMQRLLRQGWVVGHELIFGELLIGDCGGLTGRRKALLDDYPKMRQAEMVSHRDVVGFVHARGLHGRGAGWIDVHLLASALIGKWQLWTADEYLGTMARELGVDHRVQAAGKV